MTVCGRCGTENEQGRKFCMECGAPLPQLCPACGTANAPASKFCGECGAALTEVEAVVAATVAAPAGVTERRLVTALFLDLVSFTALSESRDAEDVRTLMSDYFETASAVIGRHGGSLEKFIGDAVMAVWGTPIAHEDDAERAVRAALELTDAVEALGERLHVPLRARAGVLTGEAATSPDAGNQGMVTGDMVNTASRLQTTAEPGQVLVGESTYRAAGRAIAFEEVGEVALKGKEEPVKAWRALRVVAERQGQNRMAIEPPFVGRVEELRLLKELLHATGREGKVRLVSVTGIGGIGKSRLAWELLKYIDGLADTVWWHHGRCPAYGEGVTFWALGEMVRMRAQIAETDAPGVSRQKLAATVSEHVPDEEEQRWLEPRLAFLLGLEERPAGGREELFAAWRTFFERLGDPAETVTMVFEDLQWADEGLLDFIETMLEWSRARPIFIVGLARPELADRRPTWGAGRRNFVALHLEPLSDEATTELVRAMVPGADDAAVARIVERAEGVPLYAVETIRMLADRGELRPGEGVYEIAGDPDLGALDVPETLHALIASRLDALGPEDRALLQEAAVLGKSFTLEAVAAITSGDAVGLEPRLQDLARKEFLEFEADPRSPERGQYAFVQAIIREVAYGMLSKADRRSRHLAVAHHLEGAGDEELAGVVAAHYVEALRATPAGPDADALAARARDALGQAAARATGLGSPIQALGFLEQALGITPSGRERAELLQQAEAPGRDALRLDDVIAYLREAIDVYHELDDVNAGVATMGLLASALGDRHRPEEVQPLIERMRERLGDGGDDLARAELDHAVAIVQYFSGDFEACLESNERSLSGYERAGSWERFRKAIGEKTAVLVFVGRRREATLLARGRLAVATEENDLREMAAALGHLALMSPELVDSVGVYQEAASVARRGGYGASEMNALANGLEAAVEAGAWDVADRIAEDLRGRSGLPDFVRDPLMLGVALLAAYRGDAAAADAAMTELSTETRHSAEPQIRAWTRRAEALLLLMRGELERAYEQAMTSITDDPSGLNLPFSVWTAGRAALWLGDAAKVGAVMEAAGDPPEGAAAAGLRSFRAGLLALEGRHREAVPAYETVLRGRLAVGDRFFHAQMVTDMLAVLPPELVPTEAVEAARSSLAGIGAAPLLARLEAALGARAGSPA